LFYFNDRLFFHKKIISPIIIPFIILINFLFLHKFLIGKFVGHYGSKVHLQLNISEVFSNVIRYFASYTALYNYWDYKYKIFATAFLQKQYLLLLLVVVIAFFSLLFYSLKNKKNHLLLILLSFSLAVVSLAPIANLYYAQLFPIENDRYVYLASLFIELFIVLIIYKFNWRNLYKYLLGIFLLVNVYFLFSNVSSFSKSSKLAWALLNDFRWFDKEVIVLEDPDNFKGAKMFSTINTPCSFSESLLLHTGIDRREHIKNVYQMNFVSLKDSVIVTKVSDTEYKVKLAQWGNWFWKNSIGATSFENDWCKAELHKEGLNYYNLKLKNIDSNTVIIYATGTKWSVVK